MLENSLNVDRRHSKRRGRITSYLWPVMGLAGMVLYADAAFAQTKIEQMIVTATKRSLDLQAVPASVSAFTGETLSERGIKNVADLTRSTPNLNFSVVGGTNPQLSIRGVSPDGTSTLLEGTVAMHLDGVYQPRVYSLTLSMFDLESVEVLRGPQGTVYGRNANAGVINLNTAKPTDEFEASSTAWVGDRGGLRYGVKGFVSGPVTEGVSVRLAGIVNRDEGYLKNLTNGHWVNGSNFWGVRGAIRLKPTDDVTIDLQASAIKDVTSGMQVPSSFPLQGKTISCPGLGASSKCATPPNTLLAAAGNNGQNHNYTNLVGIYGADATRLSLEPWKAYSSFDPDNTTRQYTGSATIAWDITPDVTAKLIGGYQFGTANFLIDSDGITADYLPAWPYADSWTWSTELNVNARLFDGFVDAVAGLYYMNDIVKGGNLNPITAGNPVPVVLGTSPTHRLWLWNVMEQETKAKAAFLDLTVNVFDNLRVLGGVRRSIDARRTRQNLRTFTGVPGGVTPFDFPSAALSGALRASDASPGCNPTVAVGKYGPGKDQPEQVFNSTTFRAGVQYDFTPDIMGYVQWQNGFKDGGYNVSLCDNTYLPEKIYSWEFGLKATLFNGTTTLNLTYFDYRYINMQLSRTINVSPTVITSLIDNAATASIKGMEIELNTNLTDELSADAAIGILDGKYGQLTPDAAGNIGARNGAVPGNPLVDFSGYRLPRAPKLTINAGLTYTTQLQDMGLIRLRGEYSFNGKTYFSPFMEPIATQGGYSEWNAYLNFTPDACPNLDFQVFCKNCTNKFSRYNMTTSGIMYFSRAVYAPSREIGAQVTAKF